MSFLGHCREGMCHNRYLYINYVCCRPKYVSTQCLVVFVAFVMNWSRGCSS